MRTNSYVSQKWLKAAVLGSIWAAFEIIVGSFLHNLRVPFAGTALSMFSVFMLVGFMRHWREPGVIIRAGAVAALMKSISPSAVIFGPMIAIFMEALILEGITLLLRRHLLSYMLAGALAVQWALLQKILNFLVIYGFDLVKVAEAFYQWMVIKTGLTGLSPALLFSVILGTYALAGMLAAAGGYFSYTMKSKTELPEFSMPAHQRTARLQLSEFNNYRAYHLLIIIAAVIVTMFFINTGNYAVFIPAGALFIAYVLFRYKTAIRHIRKPRIWIQFILLALIATLLWEWLSTGNYFSKEGLEIGLKMVFRAMVIIFGFSALSVELRNPFVKGILHRNGLSNLYRAMNMAFTALPYLTEQMPRFRNLLKKRNAILSALISQSDLLLENFVREARERKHIYLLTGPTQSGKTTLLREVVNLANQQGIKTEGFLAPGTFSEGRRDEIFLEPLPRRSQSKLGGRTRQPGWIQFRQFFFDPKIFRLGNQHIREVIGNDPGVVVILDEIGPLEMKGKGWYPSLELLKDAERFPQVWVVRDKLVRELYMNYMIPRNNIFQVEKTTAEEILATLKVSVQQS